MLKRASWCAALLSGLAACAAGTAPKEPTATLENTYWRLLDVGGVVIPVVDGQREPHFVLHRTRAGIAGYSGCARLDGRYTLSGNGITLRADVLSAASCSTEAASRQQALMLDAMSHTVRWRIEGERLSLLDGNGGVLSRFESVYLR